MKQSSAAYTNKSVSPAQLQTPPKKILVCQLRQIGDVLLSTPAVELLHARFPEAEIHFFTEKKCLPVLLGNPHIHTLWPLDKKALPTLWHEIQYYRKVAATGFDIVVDFQQLPRCRWVVGFSGAPVRLSFPPPWYLRPLYTNWHAESGGYAAAQKVGVLEALGIHWQGQPPRMYLDRHEKNAASTMLQQWGALPRNGEAGAGMQAGVNTQAGVNAQASTDEQANKPFFITVDITHRRETRRWPAAHYAKLMEGIADHFPQCQFIMPFGPGEEKEVRAARELCGCKDRVIVPDKMLSLRELGACMTFAAAHLGNCSAPRHMAVALGVPTITMLGSTGIEWTFPAPEHIHLRLGAPCQPCHKNSCPIGITCLKELLPEQVLPNVIEHLQKLIIKNCG